MATDKDGNPIDVDDDDTGDTGDKNEKGKEEPPKFDAAQQAYIDKIIGREKVAERERVKAATAAAAAEAKAKEDGDWEKVVEAKQKRIDELEAGDKKRSLDALRSRIAKKHSIPDDVIDLLDGDDEDTIEANAKRLAKVIVREAPKTELGSKGEKPGGKKTVSEAPAFRFGTTPKVPWPDREAGS